MKLTEDAKTIILLCTSFKSNEQFIPLNPNEYALLAKWLHDNGYKPVDMHHPEVVTKISCIFPKLTRQRLDFLLGRGVLLGFAVEEWQRSGIWIVTRSDPSYPIRYRTHLHTHTPPLLFGVGDPILLAGGGLAIVGSRNVDTEGANFAREVAKNCAKDGLLIVSGCAKGVDIISMQSALDAGGKVVGIAADNLLKKSVKGDIRKSIAEGRLLLVSPYHPSASFQVWRAMERNKLIYGLADYTLVVQSDYNKGGTWAGATEELKHKSHRPVFVRTSPPKAIQALQKLGASPWPNVVKDIKKSLDEYINVANSEICTLINEDINSRQINNISENKIESSQKMQNYHTQGKVQSAYSLILPVLLDILTIPTKLKELASLFEVSPTQMKYWLDRAIDDNHIIKNSKGKITTYLKATFTQLPL